MILAFSAGVVVTMLVYEVILPNLHGIAEVIHWQYPIFAGIFAATIIYMHMGHKKKLKAVDFKVDEYVRRQEMLIQRMPEGVVVIDEAFKITHCNDISLKNFDSDSIEALTRNLRLMNYVEEKRNYPGNNQLAFYDITDFITKKGENVNFGVVKFNDKTIELKGA
jgi:PAS domain-containing protein